VKFAINDCLVCKGGRKAMDKQDAGFISAAQQNINALTGCPPLHRHTDTQDRFTR